MPVNISLFFFPLSEAVPTVDIVFQAAAGFANLFQMWIYCFAGSYVHEMVVDVCTLDLHIFIFLQSLQVSNAVYNSMWYETSSVEIKRSIMFVIQVSNEGKTIRAGKIISLNVQYFLNVWNFITANLLSTDNYFFF